MPPTAISAHRVPLVNSDREVFSLIQKEEARQATHLELIASENIASLAVRQAMMSVLTDKYAEGYPGRRYYGGCEVVDVAGEACHRAGQAPLSERSMPTSSPTPARKRTWPSTCPSEARRHAAGHEPGPRRPPHPRQPGQLHRAVLQVFPYGVRQDTETIDYDELRRLAQEHKPKMIVGGASAYPANLDFAAFAQIARRGRGAAYVDMAHYRGARRGAAFTPRPYPHAHIVTTTTHKSFRGPRGGIIFCDGHTRRKSTRSCFPASRADR